MVLTKGAYSGFENNFLSFSVIDNHILEKPVQYTRLHFGSVAVIRVCFIYVNAHNMLV